MTQTVLILGASGRFGRHSAQAFRAAGWTVRGFKRGEEDLTQSARGVDVIINAWNPPYDKWDRDVPHFTKEVIAAAKASGATVIVPGNVYVYGDSAPEKFGPGTAHGASNPLGAIRIRMEAAYREAGVPTIILRAGDFLDTESSGNWFDKIMAAKLDSGQFRYPGPLDRPHSWAFLPDLARAAVALADARARLPRFADVPFAGFTLTGRELSDAVARVWGEPLRVTRMSWLPIQLVAPFWRIGRHLVEMRYLWSKPHHLDPSPLQEALGPFDQTPLDDALRQSLAPFRSARAEGVPART